MEKKKEENKKIDRYVKLALILLFIGLILTIWRVNVLNDKLHSEKSERRSDITTLWNMIEEEKENKVDIANTFSFFKNQIADLWMATLDDEAFEKVKETQGKNPESFDCRIGFLDVRMMRTYYSREEVAKPGKYLVVSYESGDFVYDRNGEINCYNATKEMNPEPIPCVEVCRK